MTITSVKCRWETDSLTDRVPVIHRMADGSRVVDVQNNTLLFFSRLPFVVRTLSISHKWQAIPEKNKIPLNIINQHLKKKKNYNHQGHLKQAYSFMWLKLLKKNKKSTNKQNSFQQTQVSLDVFSNVINLNEN